MVQRACHASSHQPARPESTVLLAPPWHTRALIGLMLAVGTTGTVLGQAVEQPASSRLVQSYVPLALVNVGLSLYVCRVGLERSILAPLFSQLCYDRRRLLGDVAWGAALALLVIGAENGLQFLLGVPESVAAHALQPATMVDKLAWSVVAALVAISEELVYRGYLQRQLTVLSGWLPFGVLAQALLFGIAHGEQGAWAVARFAVYALALGWAASVRKSLVPCVLCHVGIDWLALAAPR